MTFLTIRVNRAKRNAFFYKNKRLGHFTWIKVTKIKSSLKVPGKILRNSETFHFFRRV